MSLGGNDLGGSAEEVVREALVGLVAIRVDWAREKRLVNNIQRLISHKR